MQNLYASFSKRRLNLYKQASELSTLCGIDIGIIIFSPRDIPHSFFHPTMASVLERYRNPNRPTNQPNLLLEAHYRDRISQLNQEFDEVFEAKDKLIERVDYLDEIDRIRPKNWWEQVPIESLNGEEVREWITWFENLLAKINKRRQEIQNGASSSASVATQQQPMQVQTIQNLPDISVASRAILPSSYNLPTYVSSHPLGSSSPTQALAQVQPEEYNLPGSSTQVQDLSNARGERRRYNPDPFSYLAGAYDHLRREDENMGNDLGGGSNGADGDNSWSQRWWP
ncbi:agamous-like MADS-box protein AGL28 [Andrographis paniculata]|uniref:agamous-like MADS-box protein AGL28 n=1 Tax=Andrographis paniculata TaxID=175694 RepID=UPI0021E91B1F|nr:agamous-like MADS-box protein AGL28 [Andrographis paniculata]